MKNNKNNNEDVYLWLKHLTTTRPLLDEWKIDGVIHNDPVVELYQNETHKYNSLLIWIFVPLNIALICLILVAFFWHGILCKWETHHGKDCNILDSYMCIDCCISLQRTTKYSHYKGVNNYERPTDAQLEEIHIYEGGRRVTITSKTIEFEEALYQRRISNASTKSKIKDEETHVTEVKRDQSIVPSDRPRKLTSSRSLKTRFSNKNSALKKSRLRRTLPYRLTKQEAIELEHILTFQGRPLPPIPKSALNATNKDRCLPPNQVRHFENKKTLKDIHNNLLSNSARPLYHCDFGSSRKFTFSQMCNHMSINRSKSNHENIKNDISKPLRSMSLDDDFITLKKRQQKLTRRSRSLDLLEENITINKLYAEINDTLTINKEENIEGYLKVNDIKTNTAIANTSRVKQKREPIESLYAKIPELIVSNNISKEGELILSRTPKHEIQNRPLPKPYVKRDSNLSTKSDHIYQRASVMDLIKEVEMLKNLSNYGNDNETANDIAGRSQNLNHYESDNNTTGRSLSDQMSSFRSLSSNPSGPYTKILYE